jgi:hypothetical protein
MENNMSFESNNFNMGNVLNRLRAIAENGPEAINELDAATMGQETGKEIDSGSFTRTMARLASVKDALNPDHYNDLRSGVRALYMNRRPNIQQMTALMDLLETVLGYVAQDNTLFQRLKTDLVKDQKSAEQPDDTAQVAEPIDNTVDQEEEPAKAPASIRDFK